jgi:hypothetical protein
MTFLSDMLAAFSGPNWNDDTIAFLHDLIEYVDDFDGV